MSFSILDIIKSTVHFVFFLSFFLHACYSHPTVCVYYSAKPCLKKIIEFFFSTFLCLPLFTSYIHTHIYLYAWLSHIIFYLFVFYTNIFLSACIFLFVFFSCVSLFFSKKTAKKMIERYSHFFFVHLYRCDTVYD